MIRVLAKVLTDDAAIKLIIVDTLTYASGKSLYRPEDMKSLLDAVMELAMRHKCALLVLVHENKEGEALGRRIGERARIHWHLQRVNEADHKVLRLYVKESNWGEHPALLVTHEEKGVTFGKDKGTVPADRRRDCACWLVDYLFKKGPGVEVDYGTLINAAGEAGFAGDLTETDKSRRWSNPNLMTRTIVALNDETKDLDDLRDFKIKKREVQVPNRNKPRIVYWLATDIPLPG